MIRGGSSKTDCYTSAFMIEFIRGELIYEHTIQESDA